MPMDVGRTYPRIPVQRTETREELRERHKRKMQKRYDKKRTTEQRRLRELDDTNPKNPRARSFGEIATAMIQGVIWETTRTRANRINRLTQRAGSVAFEALYDAVTDDMRNNLARRYAGCEDAEDLMTLVVDVKHITELAKTDPLPRPQDTGDHRVAGDILAYLDTATYHRIRGVLKSSSDDKDEAFDWRMEHGWDPSEDLDAIMSNLESDLFRGVARIALPGWTPQAPGGIDRALKRITLNAAISAKGMDEPVEAMFDATDDMLEIDWMQIADEVLDALTPMLAQKVRAAGLPLDQRAMLAHRAAEVHFEWLAEMDRELV